MEHLQCSIITRPFHHGITPIVITHHFHGVTGRNGITASQLHGIPAYHPDDLMKIFQDDLRGPTAN